MKKTVSIVICTRNRADHLKHTLASIAACPVPADLDVELLVVDNGSTDHTRRVVHNCGISHLALRWILETRAGQCHARNRGLAEARGEIYLFTDDDVRIPRNWFSGMTEPITFGIADAVAGGVTIAPHLTSRIPEGLAGWFASTDSISSRTPQRFVGANMAFHRRVLEKVPGFDVELGPGALGFFDDTLFAYQLRSAGFQLVSALPTAVEHHFSEDRLERNALLNLAFRMGASLGYMEYHWHHGLRRDSWLKEVKCQLGLLRRRIFRSRIPSSGAAVPVWELQAVLFTGLRRQYRLESRRPRLYTQHGLRKLTAESPAPAPLAGLSHLS